MVLVFLAALKFMAICFVFGLILVPIIVYILSIAGTTIGIINIFNSDFMVIQDGMTDSIKAFLFGLVIFIIIVSLTRISRLYTLTFCLSIASINATAVVSSSFMQTKHLCISIVVGIVIGIILFWVIGAKSTYVANEWNCDIGILPSLVILFETIVADLSLLGGFGPYTNLEEMSPAQLVKWPLNITISIGVLYAMGRILFVVINKKKQSTCNGFEINDSK